jgi:ABC-type amino acid transport substrate-binding protein
MKTTKKLIAIILSVILIAVCFSGCSSSKDDKYSDETLIIGYTQQVAPFIEVDGDGNATGFIPDLWESIFKNVKGDYKSYVFEQVDEDYTLEESGGFFNEDSKTGTEYSASLLVGAVAKNSGTFNEDYSFTEPVITNRIIAVTANDSDIKNYGDFAGAKAVVVSSDAKTSFEAHTAQYNACASVTEVETIDEALSLIDSGKADVVVTDEFSFNPSDKASSYTVLDGEFDKIEYVIACAKYSDWKDSINEAIREMKSEDYQDGDTFTPLVEKYFGYNASSFNYQTDGDN